MLALSFDYLAFTAGLALDVRLREAGEREAEERARHQADEQPPAAARGHGPGRRTETSRRVVRLTPGSHHPEKMQGIH